jgi:polyisoprenoid-binding protein YceI
VKLCLRTVMPVVASVAFVALTAQAQVQGVPDGASATFDVAGPGGINIHGKTNDLSASESGGKVKVKVALGALNTGINLRDQHMRDTYLEVGKYPNAIVEVQRSKLKFPAKGASASAQAPGSMTIHGVTKPVTIDYTAKSRGDKISVDGSTKIDMRDYGIVVPKYLGVGVEPDVGINVSFKVVDR